MRDDHPAPAAVTDQDGQLHVAGEPPNGIIASSQAPVGDTTDVPAGDPSHQAEHGLSEPEQVETERPDIGTPE